MENKWLHLLAPRSFRLKVIFISIICLVIPATISLFIYNYGTQDTLKEQALSNANRELTIANEYVLKLLEDMMYIANFIQLDPELNTILKKNARSTTAPEPTDSYQHFMNESKINRTIENITLVGEKSYVTILLKNGKWYTNYSVSEFNPLQLFQEKWFTDMNQLQGYESIWMGSQPTVFQSEKKDNPFQISVARTLRDERQRIYGYVIVTIMENKINQVFEQLKGHEEMVLLDSSNHILSHKDDRRIGELFAYRNQVQRPNSSKLFQISKQDYVIAENEVTLTGWRLVSLVPYKQAIQEINLLFNKVFVVQVISFATFLLLMTYLLQTITKPIVGLGKVAEAVQRGHLHIRSGLRGQDEIGRLSVSFDQMLDRINEMIKEITDSQERKRKAELAMLQAQINPHFLFNVLNSIRMKVLVKGDRESAEMISSLSKLLRMTIDKEKETITFAEEMTIITDYMTIMNMRQKEKVHVDFLVHKETYGVRIPRFILQPIIENSIIHGLNQHAGTIVVSTDLAEKDVIITIEDNGQGMEEAALATVKRNLFQAPIASHNQAQKKNGFSSLGLSNVYERMSMTFGGSFHMDIQSESGKGTKIILSIPKGGSMAHVQSDAG